MFLRRWKNRVRHGTLHVLAIAFSATLGTALLHAGLLHDGRDSGSIDVFLQKESPAPNGNAFAGTAAAAEDSTKIFANRAGMTGLDDSVEGEGHANMIASQAKIFDRGSTMAVDGALARLRS